MAIVYLQANIISRLLSIVTWFNDLCQFDCYVALNSEVSVNDKLRKRWKEAVATTWSETLIKITGLRAEFPTRNLSNTKQEY
jgi:hypothetical protein